MPINNLKENRWKYLCTAFGSTLKAQLRISMWFSFLLYFLFLAFSLQFLNFCQDTIHFICFQLFYQFFHIDI